MKRELVLVIDFGGQYNQLVARRVRESNVYCEIYSYRVAMQKIKELNPKGIILLVVLIAAMKKELQHAKKNFSNVVFRYLAYVMVLS